MSFLKSGLTNNGNYCKLSLQETLASNPNLGGFLLNIPPLAFTGISNKFGVTEIRPNGFFHPFLWFIESMTRKQKMAICTII